MVINGMPVISNPFAREIRDEFHVEKSTIKKRRRNWMVVKHHIDKPGIYLMDGRVYVAHP